MSGTIKKSLIGQTPPAKSIQEDACLRSRTMPDARAFFVPPEHPDFTPEQQEAAYAEFAAMCRRPVPESDKRIYSITYVHDGEEWTATVGEPLRGVRYKTVRSHGQKREQRTP